jgi:hypothetical protein
MVSSDRNVRSGAAHGKVSDAAYRQLADFRYRIRQFLHFSKETTRACHIEPRQHHLPLVIKGLPEGTRPTVTALSRPALAGSLVAAVHHSMEMRKGSG